MAFGNPTNFELTKITSALNSLTKRVGNVEDQLASINHRLGEILEALKSKGSEDKK